MIDAPSLVALSVFFTAPVFASTQTPGVIRLIELNGDSRLDRLLNKPDGTPEISLGIGKVAS